jgi:hypothetical protein
MADREKGGGFFARMLGTARERVEENKKIYVERHDYRPATEADFDGRDRGWYDAAERELQSMGFNRLGEVVNATIEKAANVRAIIRRFLSADGTTMAAIYQFVRPGPAGKPGVDLRIVDLESERADASFLTTSNAESAAAATMPPQIVSAKHPANTPVADLVELHRTAQRKVLADQPGVGFVVIRTAEEYQAAQDRQQAIKAAFRAGINYVDPAEVRRIAEQKMPDDPAAVAVVTAAFDIGRRPPSPLEAVMTASDDGASPPDLGKLFTDRLAQGSDIPADKRDDIAKTVADVFAAAKTGDPKKEGLAGLISLMGKLQDMEPAEEKAARRSKFEETMARAAAEHERKQAAHAAERLARGLSDPHADTGPAEPEVLIHGLPREPLPIGASRIGGQPDLPPGVASPVFGGKKIPFIAQINLAEFPAAHGLLPADGHLFAFALISNEEAHWPPPCAAFLHRGSARDFVRAAEPADDEVWEDWTGERIYTSFPVTPTPPGRDATVRSNQFGETLGALFGEMPDYYGSPGAMADGRFLDGTDWIVLLEVGSDGNMQWSDAGSLYFVVRRSALARGDLSGVLAAACST